MDDLRTSLALTFALVVCGCSSIGAQRLGIDRADYSTHLRETNKEQLLLNIVAMRYGDAPLFLEVSSVISQYTREGSLNANVRIDPKPDIDDKGGIGGSVLLRETPTITYAPLSGERFSRSLLAPLPPASLLAMIEAGWPPELLFQLAARAINGVSNGSRDPLFARPADPEFDRVLAALGRLQRSSAMVMHITRGGDKEGFTAIASLAPGLTDTDRADLAYIVKTLHLPGGGGNDLKVVFAEAQTAPDQLAIGTRSMFEIFSEMAQGVEVPEGDQARAMPTPGEAVYGEPLIRIRSGAQRPPDAHVAVRYRARWFWIDGTDTRSKRAFLLAQILLSLNDSSGNANAPLVTIPTG